ncbi:hypothetical protein [Dickeya undicola]|uniref:hypothetical protein n=1 Tax=Dickeya undicola TaxID=1577887 RepID=UPI000532BF0A|nr:hypothetical protein [Dickeya undicola]
MQYIDGLRTAFLMTALKKIQHAPWLGNDAGGSEYDNPETGERVHNPYNQYLLDSAEGHLFIILTAMLVAGRRITKEEGNLIRR